MRIFIDIGHPAHVHYFRNFISLMQEKGHEFFISARDRSIIHYLLKYYNIPFSSRGKGKNGIIGKLTYMFTADLRLFRYARKFKPDIFLSFASPYAAQVSKLMGKSYIVLDDTEHARFGHMFYKPFTDVFLNPYCFRKNFGEKQIRFRSFTELFYLHKRYLSSDNSIRESLKLGNDEQFILLRFVSWDAHHDIGHAGLNSETKKKLVNLLINKGIKFFISSESEHIEDQFKAYLLNIPPEKIHFVLQEATLLIAESGTMASEAALSGTQVVYVNSLPLMGYLEEQQNAGILHHFSSSSGVIEKVNELLEKENLKEYSRALKNQLVEDKIDPTAFLVWFVENYPESFSRMKQNPEYQEIFNDNSQFK